MGLLVRKETHLEHIAIVLQVLQQNHFVANKNKCAFGQEKVEFMDHVISKAGVTVDPANVESKPLTELTKKEGFKWNEAAAEAFQKLKVAVTTAPVLVLPNFKLPFEIECDASGRGVGAVLMQMRHPIAYFSKALASSKLYKSAYDKELMALVLAIQHWPHYLLAISFPSSTLSRLVPLPPYSFHCCLGRDKFDAGKHTQEWLVQWEGIDVGDDTWEEEL
ncbi:retrotransposon-related protein, partial [Trifolium pratense]